jgi:hypothetical protein
MPGMKIKKLLRLSGFAGAAGDCTKGENNNDKD